MYVFRYRKTGYKYLMKIVLRIKYFEYIKNIPNTLKTILVFV